MRHGLPSISKFKSALTTAVTPLLCVLAFSSDAFAVPVYLAPGHRFPSGNFNREWLKERTKEQFQQRWFRVRTRASKVGWIAADHILTREMLKDGLLAFVKEGVSLNIRPVVRSEALSTANMGEKIMVMSQPAPVGWVPVKRGSFVGFVPRNALLLAEDIKPGTALSLESQSPLRSQSVPFAEPIARAEKLEELTVLTSKVENWGRVAVKHGHVWWPMNGDVVAPGETKPATLRLLTSQLFQRKLYDMASSPLSRELKIASAGGIFRTTNGREWTKLVQFKNENHPVAVSTLGRIFIGPYFSDDNGLTFSEYIRWDLLISRLKQTWKLDGETIRLVEIHPSSKDINALELLLDVGLPHKVTVSTHDLGRNWLGKSL